ncbi:hypothetical protein [Jeotgalibacillus soli]|uniref:Uncharacterized protein n=1 Tax=Jeotgalibacillus soli TaxID=889306 RepID=A0A0C2V5S2_9BACL|nr:hypothetical protein [Jeotgalibacillus soli]KIL44342.1 hypothetical protein KP78_33060 [Jeotgalibacillus soli]
MVSMKEDDKFKERHLKLFNEIRNNIQSSMKQKGVTYQEIIKTFKEEKYGR